MRLQTPRLASRLVERVGKDEVDVFTERLDRIEAESALHVVGDLQVLQTEAAADGDREWFEQVSREDRVELTAGEIRDRRLGRERRASRRLDAVDGTQRLRVDQQSENLLAVVRWVGRQTKIEMRCGSGDAQRDVRIRVGDEGGGGGVHVGNDSAGGIERYGRALDPELAEEAHGTA